MNYIGQLAYRLSPINYIGQMACRIPPIGQKSYIKYSLFKKMKLSPQNYQNGLIYIFLCIFCNKKRVKQNSKFL